MFIIQGCSPKRIAKVLIVALPLQNVIHSTNRNTTKLTSHIYRASVFPFQNCVNSVSGFANSVFYRFRFYKFHFLPFRIFRIPFHFFQAVFLVSMIFLLGLFGAIQVLRNVSFWKFDIHPLVTLITLNRTSSSCLFHENLTTSHPLLLYVTLVWPI